VRVNWGLTVNEAVTLTQKVTKMAANGDPITLEDGWGYVQTKVIGPLKVRHLPPTRLSMPPIRLLLANAPVFGTCLFRQRFHLPGVRVLCATHTSAHAPTRTPPTLHTHSPTHSPYILSYRHRTSWMTGLRTTRASSSTITTTSMDTPRSTKCARRFHPTLSHLGLHRARAATGVHLLLSLPCLSQHVTYTLF
jgi:hypothetical protein